MSKIRINNNHQLVQIERCQERIEYHLIEIQNLRFHYHSNR